MPSVSNEEPNYTRMFRGELGMNQPGFRRGYFSMNMAISDHFDLDFKIRAHY